MSSVLVERTSVDTVVAAMVRYDIVASEWASQAGGLLVEANVAALHNPWRPEVVAPYHYRPTVAPAGVVGKCLRHFIYQSCEGPAWLDSQARDMCMRLAVALLDQIPGYREAAWE